MAAMVDVKAVIAHAVALHRQGELARAEAIYQQLLAVRPGHAQVSYLLGALRNEQGRSAEALPLLEAAHRAKPDNISVLLHMGNAFQALQRYDEAVVRYDAALALQPDFADALNNRGNALRAMNRFDEALTSFDAALAWAPQDVRAWYNRGGLLQQMGRNIEAIADFDRALAIQPGHGDTFNNRGSAFLSLHQPAAALASFERAVALRSDDAGFRMNRAAALCQLDRFGEALAEYDRVHALAPNFPNLFGQMALTALYECNWPRMAQLSAELATHVQAGDAGISPWTLIGYGAGNGLLATCARQTSGRFVADTQPRLWNGECYGRGRIRLAYISADLQDHPVGYQLVEVLERHDRGRFEVIAISSGADDSSPARARIVAACDQFHDMAKASDRSMAERLRALEVDIAVDLSGHTHGTRLAALGLRPAPVQVAWLGYPGTTGADFIDYLIGDAIVTPPEHQPFYSEKIERLPSCFFPLDTGRTVGAAPTRAEAGLPETGFVFCCFNRNWKISAAMFDIWIRLLRSVPDSVLWLREYTASSGETLKREAHARGIDPARLVFAGKVPIEAHVARHQLADLFLDTAPYNAHTTAADALWAGLPVLTLMGEVFAARVGASLLTAVGLPELITRIPADYEATALALARDPAQLKALRDRLAANRASAFDMGRFTREMEAAYLKMLAKT